MGQGVQPQPQTSQPPPRQMAGIRGSHQITPPQGGECAPAHDLFGGGEARALAKPATRFGVEASSEESCVSATNCTNGEPRGEPFCKQHPSRVAGFVGAPSSGALKAEGREATIYSSIAGVHPANMHEHWRPASATKSMHGSIYLMWRQICLPATRQLKRNDSRKLIYGGSYVTNYRPSDRVISPCSASHQVPTIWTA